ncbi:uncharacterized protein TM35_000153150 [Trypanosoma theileri]|uniref:Uncharacterized protein n=1 Tax=Trypanosoma theileri TaxID=67003 RepID=A0A1X0NW05_9TRYP|nr:uncharacterized protein TM35_000153150 [Trypanosoma theileri]ORC88884.1 hypothetical protein TM35_000153150 [Trypanosoma theileri]
MGNANRPRLPAAARGAPENRAAAALPNAEFHRPTAGGPTTTLLTPTPARRGNPSTSREISEEKDSPHTLRGEDAPPHAVTSESNAPPKNGDHGSSSEGAAAGNGKSETLSLRKDTLR